MAEFLNVYFLFFGGKNFLNFNPLISRHFVPKLHVLKPLETQKMA